MTVYSLPDPASRPHGQESSDQPDINVILRAIDFVNTWRSGEDTGWAFHHLAEAVDAYGEELERHFGRSFRAP